MSDLIVVKIVYDGGESVFIPSELGMPRGDQMQGTAAEQLVELAGRACYDSLGKGRPSFTAGDTQGYHDHIKSVNHGSVWEHANFTIEIPFGTTVVDDNRKLLTAFQCANRPGVLCIPVSGPSGLRVTANLRSVIEWSSWTKSLYGKSTDQFNLDNQIAFMLADAAKSLAPRIVDIPSPTPIHPWPELSNARLSLPITDHERWISMFMTGSRGLSHELVRHGDFTAISQRSTRYVDESESPWVEHPLEAEYWKEKNGAGGRKVPHGVISESQNLYRQCVATLEPWLIARGVDKLTARKQARGAARGYLGNALHTELIFSANVAQWKRMLRQRATVHADAEIRELFCKAFYELCTSRYKDSFNGWSLGPSPDGIGHVVTEPKNVNS